MPSLAHVDWLAPKFIVLYVFFGAMMYIHLRGRVKLKFYRQLTDHSTFMAPYNTLMYMFSAVPNKPFIDVDRFPEMKVLTENWRTIREEALKLFDEGHIRAAAGYTDLGFNSFFRRGWKRFYVKWYDEPLPSAKALCPRTVALVESIPTVNGAMFALLPPGGKLNRHRDPYAGSLRYHLGLVTPNAESCRIFVDGEPYHWRDGEAVIFDETFIHWAENKSDVTRLILFCDVERPLTNRLMRKVNHFFKSTAVRASQTENAPGDQIGLLNQIFRFAYYARVPGKWLKEKSRFTYYATKWVVLAAFIWVMLQ